MGPNDELDCGALIRAANANANASVAVRMVRADEDATPDES